MIFLSAVMFLNKLNCWNTIPTRLRMSGFHTPFAKMLLPSNRMSPPVGISSRFNWRRKVDLPQPEGPITAITSPRWMSKEIPLRICLSP